MTIDKLAHVLIAALALGIGLLGCAAPQVAVLPATPAAVGAAPVDLALTNTPSVSPTLPVMATPLRFDGLSAYEAVLAQLEFGPRPAGSQAIAKTGDYIIASLQRAGWAVETQEFTYRGVPIRNIIAKTMGGKGPLIILGAHYDTRPLADQDPKDKTQPVLGANDGASGVAALLELARTLDRDRLKNDVWLAFFDAEDNGGHNACALNIVPMQPTYRLPCDTTLWDWSVGATYVAEHLETTPAAVVVVDMIGDASQQIYYERNSDGPLMQELWQIAAQLGYQEYFIPRANWSITDDHTPFLRRGIRAVDIIDFDYPAWHTAEDTADKVSAASLERVGRVLETWLEEQ